MEWLKKREAGATRFRNLIQKAESGSLDLRMSLINLGEVYYNCAKARIGGSPDAVLSRMHGLPITYISVSDETVYAAARLKAAYPIAYADAFAAQLAIQYRCPLATGDMDFKTLEQAGILTLEWMGA